MVTQSELHNYLAALEGHLTMLDKMHELITVRQRKIHYVCIKNDINLQTTDGLKAFRRKMHKLEDREPTAYNDILLDNINWAPWEIYLALLDAVVDYYVNHIRKKTPDLIFFELEDFLQDNEDAVVTLHGLRDAILHPNALDSQMEEFVKCTQKNGVHHYDFAQSLHSHIRGLFHFLVGFDLCKSISSESSVNE